MLARLTAVEIFPCWLEMLARLTGTWNIPMLAGDVGQIDKEFKYTHVGWSCWPTLMRCWLAMLVKFTINYVGWPCWPTLMRCWLGSCWPSLMLAGYVGQLDSSEKLERKTRFERSKNPMRCRVRMVVLVRTFSHFLHRKQVSWLSQRRDSRHATSTQ